MVTYFLPKGQVWKRVWILEVYCLKTVWKITFFGLKSGQDLKNRGAHPHEEFPGVPPRGGFSLATGPMSSEEKKQSVY